MAHGKRTNGYSNLKFWGYRRENGRVGVRNHVVILPLDDLSNAACEAVANNIKGTLALPHAYGRLQFGQDLDLHFRTLIGTGSRFNVFYGYLFATALMTAAALIALIYGVAAERRSLEHVARPLSARD